MEPDQQLRNLRDFLLVYNRMTEICFQRCTSNFNYRSLTLDEEQCVDSCAGKLIRSNHRLMGTYVQLMPKMVQRRMEEMESKAAENAKAAEAESSRAAVPAVTEGLSTSETSIAPFPPSQVAPLISTAEAVGPVQMPTEPGQAVDKPVLLTNSPVLGEAMFKSEVTGLTLTPSDRVEPAATTITPVTETLNAAALLKADNGPGYMTASLESPFKIREPPPNPQK